MGTIHEAVAAELNKRGQIAAVHPRGDVIRIAVNNQIALDAINADDAWEVHVLIGADNHTHTLDTSADSRSENVREIADALETAIRRASKNWRAYVEDAK